MITANADSAAGNMSEKWTTDRIPDQRGRTAVVTGANSGLGFVTARELARAGASVTLACRDTDRGADAARRIEAAAPGAAVEVAALDLGSLASVQAFAGRFRGAHEGLDLLINNAGVMAPPRRVTSDGFELQLATNYLGHFALTCRLLGAMQGRTDARVVTLSSNAHKMARIDFDDLQSEHHYKRWRAYAQSKLADLSFALELDRRLRAGASTVRSLAAHPGYAATNLQSSAPPTVDRLVMAVTNRFMAQSAEMGALPTLYAATEPGLEGGTYIGPDGAGEFRGHPVPVTPSQAARDEQTAARLWALAEQLTAVSFSLGADAPV
jgi:NAD(P)-dependent dehydrogenase (short-subunit alcohol dehydrogenase family)